MQMYLQTINSFGQAYLIYQTFSKFHMHKIDLLGI